LIGSNSGGRMDKGCAEAFRDPARTGRLWSLIAIGVLAVYSSVEQTQILPDTA